jgi:hypothetical protein
MFITFITHLSQKSNSSETSSVPLTACFRLCAKAHRANYHALYPIGKSVWSYFPDDVGAAIDIGIEKTAISSPEQSSLQPLACIGFMLAYRLVIEKTALAGVGLFGDDDANAHQFGEISQHLDEAGMRHRHELLVVPFAHVHFLFTSSGFCQ